MTILKLGQLVRLTKADVEVRVVGLMEPAFGGRVLVDWDGAGTWQFWVEAADVEVV